MTLQGLFMTPLATALPATTLYWLFVPVVAMFLVALLHSLKHWNKSR